MALADRIDGLKALWKFDNRWQLLLSRLCFREHGLNVYCLNGMQILVDHQAGDESGTRHVLVSPMYQQFLPQMTFKAPINVLDLGANGGGFALMLKCKGIALRKVVAVEFNPNTYARLHFNLTQNLDCQAIALNAAAVGETKLLQLQVGQGGTSDNIYQPLTAGNTKMVMIEGLTIDDLYNRYFDGEKIDVCKMDIEGAEHEIFSMPYHHSLKHVRYLILEIHGNDDRRKDAVIHALKKLGFKSLPRVAVNEQDVYFFANDGEV
ncbi:MAG: FkbM family methyltransferase [Candidatus Thermochlorobacter sp.]